MQRRTHIQISSLIVFLSIFTILVQFVTYYFFASFYIIFGVSCLVSLLSCHILLEQTATYEACFLFSFLTLFISMIIITLTYFSQDQSFLPYTIILLGIAIINWLIPTLHCFLRYMLDYGTKVDHYTEFYRNSSIVFILFYLILIAYGAFANDAFAWAYPATTETANMTPFLVIATQIEDYLYELIPLNNIITYLLSRIVTYLPYGFYITLALRRHSRLPRYFALLLFPFLIEVFQFFLIPSRCDIDDIFYALIGGIMGSLFYFLTSLIFRTFSGKEFLTKDANYLFSNSSLHF